MASVKQLTTEVEDNGYTSEDMDDMVIEAASCLASTINNSGLEEQLEFVLSRGYSYDNIRKYLEEI